MMSRLPDRIDEKPQEVSLWMHVKPWIYMAAMFAGIALMVKLFVGSPESSLHTNGLSLSSSAEIEEFYDYYEDQVVKSYYRETFYLALDDADPTDN